MKKLFVAAVLLFSVPLSYSAPATRLVISVCGPAAPPIVPPCQPVIPIYQLGQPVSFWVSAVDAAGLRATGYTGTVVFSSSDGSALLPTPLTFAAGDNSVFLTSITFNSPGILPGIVGGGSRRHTVTAVDAANQFSTTVDDFSVFGNSAFLMQPIPTLADYSLIGLGVILGIVGFLALSSRSVRNS